MAKRRVEDILYDGSFKNRKCDKIKINKVLTIKSVFLFCLDKFSNYHLSRFARKIYLELISVKYSSVQVILHIESKYLGLRTCDKSSTSTVFATYIRVHESVNLLVYWYW